MGVDELLELLPRGTANMGRYVLIRTGVELCGAIIAVEPVYADGALRSLVFCNDLF